MTSVPRDPAFWKRFSTAVHLDEEKSASTVTATDSGRPKLKHSNSWLDQQHAKKRRNRRLLCFSALTFAVIVTAIVLAVVYIANNGSLTQHVSKDGTS